MFEVIEFSKNTQRAMCMLIAAVIVAASLGLGAFAAESIASKASYTVMVHE